ncbi:MAG: redoxin domain-containing protein, partial [Chloroflexi bacterium]|nr:redoxin domain-containing protein [Chloroflexota bacterium]
GFHAIPVPRWALGVLSTVFIVGAAQFFVDSKGVQGAFTAVSFGDGAGRVTVGEAAPDFVAADLSGNPVRLSDFQGKPVWINFWATWCPPCRAEMPEINAAYKEARAAGLALLAISVSEDRNIVATYLQQTGVAIPALLDREGLVASRYGVSGFPTHVFIDREGVVRDIRVGGLNQRAIRERLLTILTP